MAISDTQKVDWLWKKIVYGAAKTDTSDVKDAINEGVSSPLIIQGDNIWVDSANIPAVKPAASSSIVEIYDDSGGGQSTVEAVEDTTATANRTWKTNLVNWIPTEFGPTYLVKIYVDSASAVNPQTTGTQLFPVGSGNSDEWVFDYQSGILNFIGDNLPAGIAGNSIYIVGARYIGAYNAEIYNHTWAVAGNITAATLPCMFVLTGNTAGYNEVVEFSRYRAKIGSGSGSIDVKFQKNGVDITNTSQTINTLKQTVTFTAETLVNEDELTVVTSSPTNSPVDLSVTAFFTRKRYIS